ncbi:MAG: hypothetical protein GY945_09990 [Rhodobacteraceae bacterium]|nr:hypothetical protein [Paracoccaceae bacterium]
MNNPLNIDTPNINDKATTRSDPRPGSRFIEDADGSKSAALGQALEDLLATGIDKKKLSPTEFLMPHRQALCKLKQSGASYTDMAEQLSAKMGFPISAKAVANVVASGRSKQRKPIKAQTKNMSAKSSTKGPDLSDDTIAEEH